MEIVLVRHAARERGKIDDERSPLTDLGRRQVRELVESLTNQHIRCGVILSSNYVHALETANILKDHNSGARVYEICSFTPHSGRETLEEIIAEAERNGLDLSKMQVVTFVGHEPRIGQLYTRLSSEKVGQLGNGEALGVSGTWDEFLQGRGKMKFRTAKPASEESGLAEKVHRKMEVSVFLGALMIPALVEVVKTESVTMSLMRAVSAGFLTLALALYIAAVYIYDELSMPERFWSKHSSGRRWPPLGAGFREHLSQGGPVYAHMVHAWKFVFTPGVACSVLGFLALFWDVACELPRWKAGLGCVGALVIGYGVYLFARPRLAVD